MIVAKTFSAVCRGCKKTFTLREYVGLEGGLYGNHWCDEISKAERKHTARWKIYDKLKEVLSENIHS